MLTVYINDSYLLEREYVIHTIFGDFFGLDYQTIVENREDVLIEYEFNSNRKRLHIADVIFNIPEKLWLKQISLPSQPLREWNTQNIFKDDLLVSARIPLIYATERCLIDDSDELYLGLDIFGSAFFMLTRYEEQVRQDRDEHDRFPARASLAFQEGFLDRPIINEYIEILWWCLKRLWPGMTRKKRSNRILVSHDVDKPFAQALISKGQILRTCAGDILYRRSPQTAWQRFQDWQAVTRKDYKQDPNYTFDYLMDVSEKRGLRSSFYFQTAGTSIDYDDGYSVDHPYIRKLFRDIHQRGHEIGLHPSYETFRDPVQTRTEFARLINLCDEEKIAQDRWGGRQHWLRWEVPGTWRNWEMAGLDYDSTLTYPERSGFRCGICYEYPVFDLEARRPLKLLERPLVIMEGSILGEEYMSLNPEAAYMKMKTLKDSCCRFNGDFTLLWHNSSFHINGYRELYESILT